MAIWRFGDLFHFQNEMVLYIMTQVIKRYAIVVALGKHTVSENYLRVRISKENNNDGQETFVNDCRMSQFANFMLS